MRLPSDIKTKLSPLAQRKLQRLIDLEVNRQSSLNFGRVHKLVASLAGELAAELEISYEIKDMVKIAPEAISYLREVRSVLMGAQVGVPEEVVHLLDKVDKVKSTRV